MSQVESPTSSGYSSDSSSGKSVRFAHEHSIHNLTGLYDSFKGRHSPVGQHRIGDAPRKLGFFAVITHKRYLKKMRHVNKKEQCKRGYQI